MKIITYNVNGIRSAMTKGFVEFIKREDPDVICLQEIKANYEDIDEKPFLDMGYHCYWYSAQKKGYSGVAILSKQKPDLVIKGCGHALFDFEGRVIQADFGNVSVLSCYFPSGTTGDIRQTIKYQFLDHFMNYIKNQRFDKLSVTAFDKLSVTAFDKLNVTDTKSQRLVVCGDYNICHKEIDIHDPKGNKNSSGFLPEERAWMDEWFATGMVDTFRHLNPEPHNYTWWSFRANARANNKGWRIDYISISESMKNDLKASGIYSKDLQSDHCGSYVIL